MSASGASPWPVPIQALGPSSVATVVFRHRGAFNLTVVVKSSFQWMQGQRCQIAAPEPISRADRLFDGEGARSPERVSDIAPFLPRAEVRVTGHAYSPPGVMVPASSVRLGVFRDVSLVEKTIHVYGDRRSAREGPRPFQRMPLRYELAVGGPGTDNPVGVSPTSGVTPNLVAPDDPQRPVAFSAIGRAWPPRARLALQIAGLDAPVYDLADDFDFSYFQAAPPDQQIEALGGDEWLLLDGMHPSAPRLSAQLPGARAEALVWAETGPSAGMRWSPPLALDTVLVDGDKHRVDLVWRGSFTLPGGDAIVPDLRAAAGVEAGQAIVWPDIEAALHTRKRAALVVPSIEETNPEPEQVMQRQETQAVMGAVPSALPFQQAGRSPATGAAPSSSALPWDVAPRGPLSSVTSGDTPLPDEDTPMPALPFSRIAPETLAAAEATFASSHADVESTFDALATGSTAPPPPETGAPMVEVPRPPPVPVVVPPPAIASGPLGGGMLLGYEGKAPAPAPLAQPPVPPARVSLPSFSSEIPILHEDSSSAGTLVDKPTMHDEPSSDRTDVRAVAEADLVAATPPGPAPRPDGWQERFESDSTETTAPAGLALRPPAVAPSPPPAAPLDDKGRVRLRVASGEDLSGEDFSRLDLSGVDLSGASLARAVFAGANLRGCNLARAKLADAKLTGADLEGADLTGADLTRADLTRVKLGNAILRDAQIAQTVFVGAEAERADFAGAKGARVSFARARLRGASFALADLASADMTGAVLEGADLRGAQLADAILDDVRADEASFEEARLVRVRGHGASLARARLGRAVASGSNWDRATFDGADATGCDLADAALLRTSLTSAMFRESDLRGAKLANATGDDVDFTSARFDGADLRQARLDGAKLDGAALVKVVATKLSCARASLVDADLRSGNFRGARMKGADLSRASLRDTDLRDADLEEARLDGADRTGARLQGANLDGSTGVDPTNA